MGNWAIPGYWAKREPEVWDLEKQTRQKEAPEQLEWGSRDLFGQKKKVIQTRLSRIRKTGTQELSEVPSCTFLHLISKDTRESRGQMVNLKKVD